jgi:hypothetical protein
VNRRNVVRLGLLAGVGATGALTFRPGAEAKGKRISAERVLNRIRRFAQPLAIPEPLTPVRRSESADYYQITMRPALKEFVPGVPTEVWGYNGRVPGPTIEAQRGRSRSHRNRPAGCLHNGPGLPVDDPVAVLPFEPQMTGAPRLRGGDAHQRIARGEHRRDGVVLLQSSRLRRAARAVGHGHRTDQAPHRHSGLPAVRTTQQLVSTSDTAATINACTGVPPRQSDIGHVPSRRHRRGSS